MAIAPPLVPDSETELITYYCVGPETYVRFEERFLADSVLAHLSDPSTTNPASLPVGPDAQRKGHHTLSLSLRISPAPPHEYEFPTLKRVNGSRYLPTGGFCSWRALWELNKGSIRPPPNMDKVKPQGVGAGRRGDGRGSSGPAPADQKPEGADAKPIARRSRHRRGGRRAEAPAAEAETPDVTAASPSSGSKPAAPSLLSRISPLPPAHTDPQTASIERKPEPSASSGKGLSIRGVASRCTPSGSPPRPGTGTPTADPAPLPATGATGRTGDAFEELTKDKPGLSASKWATRQSEPAGKEQPDYITPEAPMKVFAAAATPKHTQPPAGLSSEKEDVWDALTKGKAGISASKWATRTASPADGRPKPVPSEDVVCAPTADAAPTGAVDPSPRSGTATPSKRAARRLAPHASLPQKPPASLSLAPTPTHSRPVSPPPGPADDAANPLSLNGFDSTSSKSLISLRGLLDKLAQNKREQAIKDAEVKKASLDGGTEAAPASKEAGGLGLKASSRSVSRDVSPARPLRSAAVEGCATGASQQKAPQARERGGRGSKRRNQRGNGDRAAPSQTDRGTGPAVPSGPSGPPAPQPAPPSLMADTPAERLSSPYRTPPEIAITATASPPPNQDGAPASPPAPASEGAETSVPLYERPPPSKRRSPRSTPPARSSPLATPTTATVADHGPSEPPLDPYASPSRLDWASMVDGEEGSDDLPDIDDWDTAAALFPPPSPKERPSSPPLSAGHAPAPQVDGGTTRPGKRGGASGAVPSPVPAAGNVPSISSPLSGSGYTATAGEVASARRPRGRARAAGPSAALFSKLTRGALASVAKDVPNAQGK